MSYPKESPPWGQNIDSGVDDEIDDLFDIEEHGYGMSNRYVDDFLAYQKEKRLDRIDSGMAGTG